MARRLWAGVGALALGSAFFAAAHVAGASSGGGVLEVGEPGASAQVDPQLAYSSTAWWLEDATGAYLYRWSPRARLVPEVASRVVVSHGDVTYTFTLWRGFRFSDGAPVTARNFAYAIRRLRARELGSPGADFASGIRLVKASGRTLVIGLAQADRTATRSGFGLSDPADDLNPYVSGRAPYAGRYRAALKLHGQARARALARLDLDLMRNLAPTAVMGTQNAQFLFSGRVDLDSLAHQPAAANWSIASLALK